MPIIIQIRIVNMLRIGIRVTNLIIATENMASNKATTLTEISHC